MTEYVVVTKLDGYTPSADVVKAISQNAAVEETTMNLSGFQLQKLESIRVIELTRMDVVQP